MYRIFNSFTTFHCFILYSQDINPKAYLSNSVEDTKIDMNRIFFPNYTQLSSEHARRCIVLRLRASVSAGNFPNAGSPLIVDAPTSTRCFTCHQVARLLDQTGPGGSKSLATRWLNFLSPSKRGVTHQVVSTMEGNTLLLGGFSPYIQATSTSQKEAIPGIWV